MIRLILIIAACVLLSACQYHKATCYQDGKLIYATRWVKDKSKMPKYRGGMGNQVYWKIEGLDKPVIASCTIGMK